MCRRLVAPTRQQVLRLYKNLIFESKKLIIPSRREWLMYKIRKDFRAVQNETDETTIIDHFRLGEVHLDSIIVQVAHLNRPFLEQPNESATPQPARAEEDELDNVFDDPEPKTTKKETPQKKIQSPQLEYYSNTVPISKED